jgi:GT2 family glycosyltransferase
MSAAVGYVCTNYNNSRYTRAAVASLHADAARDDVRVVVVDNHSGDADREALRALAAEFPNVDVVFSAENAGYFPGLNVGIRRMRERFPEVELMVVGNNDLEFPTGFVATVQRERAVLDQWAVVAPDLVAPDGQHQNPHVLHSISRLRRLVWDIYFVHYWAAMAVRLAARWSRRFTVREENAAGSTLWRTAGPVEQGYGACYLLGPCFFKHFTGFYAPTFLMQEEYFLYEQLCTIDQLTYYDPRFVVRHVGHATMGALPSRRHWAISRDAHRVYKDFFRRSEHERRRLISSVAQGQA